MLESGSIFYRRAMRSPIEAGLTKLLGSLVGRAGQEKSDGNGYGDLLALNDASTAARKILSDESEAFLLGVVNNVEGKRHQILNELSAQPAETIEGLLMVYLQNTNGSDRTHWFGGVIDNVTKTLDGSNQHPKALKLSLDLFSQISQLPRVDWMSEETKRGIMEHLGEYISAHIEETPPGSSFSYPKAGSVGAESQAAGSQGLSPQHR